jgi:hypothetical protein
LQSAETSSVSQGPADALPSLGASLRLARLMAGPSSKRAVAAGSFERALLLAWSEAGAPEELLARWLTPVQRAELEGVRRRGAHLPREEEASRFLAQVFQLLPKPVLVRTREGMIWNRAFGGGLEEEARREGGASGEPLRRFFLLLDRGGALRLARLLVPLGERAFSVQREDFPGGSALYLTPLSVTLPPLSAHARAVALLKASGLAHKQIAHLCDRSKSHVDHLSATHRVAFGELRSALCHASVD